ncbi:unnamed protein product [Rotaria socialis]
MTCNRHYDEEAHRQGSLYDFMTAVSEENKYLTKQAVSFIEDCAELAHTTINACQKKKSGSHKTKCTPANSRRYYTSSFFDHRKQSIITS